MDLSAQVWSGSTVEAQAQLGAGVVSRPDIALATPTHTVHDLKTNFIGKCSRTLSTNDISTKHPFRFIPSKHHIDVPANGFCVPNLITKAEIVVDLARDLFPHDPFSVQELGYARPVSRVISGAAYVVGRDVASRTQREDGPEFKVMAGVVLSHFNPP